MQQTRKISKLGIWNSISRNFISMHTHVIFSTFYNAEYIPLAPINNAADKTENKKTRRRTASS